MSLTNVSTSAIHVKTLIFESILLLIVWNSWTVFSDNVFAKIVFSASVSTKSSSLQSSRNHLLCWVFRVCGWVLIYVVAKLLFFYGWFIYAVVAELFPANLQKRSYKKCAFRGEKAIQSKNQVGNCGVYSFKFVCDLIPIFG